MFRIGIIFLITLAVVMAAATTASGRTWCILPDGSGDAPTIQDGINAAVAGDSVLLAAGTYTGVGNRDIDFLGKAITVTSESGRDVTIIDCEGLGRGFIFQSGEGLSSALLGVTIRNGTAQYSDRPFGGGIFCAYQSSPTISGNTVSGNYADLGGGICCYVESSPTISGSTISGNSSSSGGGVFIALWSSPTINNTIIAFSSTGEGLYCVDSSWPALTNCDIYGNVGGDALCGTDGGGNISADPLFCDPNNGNFYLNCTSPCVNNPGYGQIGAFGVGCGPTAVQNTTWGRIKSMFR
jgi:parallel beta-helix repeat protein